MQFQLRLSGDAAPVGMDLGQYRITRLIGIGGMGEVYLADDPLVGRQVAIKRMKPFLTADDGAKARFLREAKAMGAVDHENVVPIYQVGLDALGVPYIVMPLLAGETLAERLNRDGLLATSDLLSIGTGVAAGLAAAHAKGLIHRDVKPSNVWLEPSPNGGFRVKLLDFGLARAADGAEGPTLTGAVLGTPAYMSPEQADGKPVDFRTDLFSLGIVLYRATTGNSPFQRETTTATLNAVGNHEPPDVANLNAAVPVNVSALIRRLMAKAPADRPASANEVVESIRRLDLGSSPAPETVTLGHEPRPHSVGRRRGLWVGGSIVVLVAAVALIWLAVRPRSASVVDVKYEIARTDRKLADKAPLSTGDRLSIHAILDRPGYWYVLWVNVDGTVERLYPWESRDGTTGRSHEVPTAAFDKAYTIGSGPDRLETIVVLVRTTRLPDHVELPGPFAPIRMVRPADYGVIQTHNGELAIDRSRGPSAEFDPRDPIRPVLDAFGALRDRGTCDEFCTLSFATRGDR